MAYLVWTNEAPVMVAGQSLELGSGWAEVTDAPALTPSNIWAILLLLEPGTRLFRLRLQ